MKLKCSDFAVSIFLLVKPYWVWWSMESTIDCKLSDFRFSVLSWKHCKHFYSKSRYIIGWLVIVIYIAHLVQENENFLLAIETILRSTKKQSQVTHFFIVFLSTKIKPRVREKKNKHFLSAFFCLIDQS